LLFVVYALLVVVFRYRIYRLWAKEQP